MLLPTARHIRRHGSGSNAAKRKIERLLLDVRDAQKVGRLQHAWDLCEAALKLNPQDVDALCAYSSLAIRVGRPEVAVEAAHRATTFVPDHAEAHHCLGVARRHCGQFQEAIASLGRALELQPDRWNSLLDLSIAFLDAGDAIAAEPFLNRALDVDSSSAAAQVALGKFYKSTGRREDAMAAYRRAVALDPKEPDAYDHLGSMLREAGDLDGSIAAYAQTLALTPDRPDRWSNLLLTLQCSDRFSAQEIAEKHREFGRHFAKLVLPLPAPLQSPPSGRRLKIGYVSSAFRRHAVAKFFEPLIDWHDVSRFEIHCYYNGVEPDDVTERLRAQAEHFSTICGMRDGGVAAQIRRDGIDILVDLDGHTMHNRLLVFFLRPAPIQVTWLGYLATTGIAAMDYRLTDHRADPPGPGDDLHTETLWRLPTTAWCYRPYDEAPLPGPPPFVANGFVTFVSLNNPGKLTRSALELWAVIMRDVPMSRLILHVSRTPSRVTELEAFFGAHGIAPDRIDLVDRQSIDQYFVLYNHGDIALDTWPCAGGTTTCDALWMGVPVVTLAGDRSFSRTGVSLLASVGLSEFAAQTPAEYVAKTIALAHDHERLASLRSDLRRRMQSCCLLDGPGLARDVETAFLSMWERHVARRDGGQT